MRVLRVDSPRQWNRAERCRTLVDKLQCIGVGSLSVIVPMYNSECAPPYVNLKYVDYI